MIRGWGPVLGVWAPQVLWGGLGGGLDEVWEGGPVLDVWALCLKKRKSRYGSLPQYPGSPTTFWHVLPSARDGV